MGNIGIKISKVNEDVKTATDDNLIFTSKYSYLKSLKTGLATHTFASEPGVGDTVLITINHNLGYIPAIDALITNSSFAADLWASIPFSFFTSDCPGIPPPTSTYTITAYADVNNLKLNIERIDDSGGCPYGFNGTTMSMKYYIFADPGS